MENKQRLIYANALIDRFKLRIKWLDKDVHDQYSLGLFHGAETDVELVDEIPTVDAVAVDEIKLHHVIIDNEGVPEVKLQIGDRYFILRTDPVDVREVVHGQWVNPYINRYGHPCHCCSECGFKASYQDKNYCPNCGAYMMDGDKNGKL